MAFSVNRHLGGIFILRSRLKKRRSVWTRRYFVRASYLVALFPPAHGLQLPRCWVESGAAALSLLGADGLRKMPSSAGPFASPLCHTTVGTDCTQVTELCWPLSLLTQAPSGLPWWGWLARGCGAARPSWVSMLPLGWAPSEPWTSPATPAQPQLSWGVPSKGEGARPSPPPSSQPCQCWSSWTGAMAWPLSPCTGPSWRRDSLPQALSSHMEEVKLWCRRCHKGAALGRRELSFLLPAAIAPWRWQKVLVLNLRWNFTSSDILLVLLPLLLTISVLNHLYGPLSLRITWNHGLFRFERHLWRSFSPTSPCQSSLQRTSKAAWEGHHWCKRKTRWTHSSTSEWSLLQQGPILAAAWRAPSMSLERWWALAVLEWVLVFCIPWWRGDQGED